MRILLYNFVQPEESGAGGVGVYLKNLTRALSGAHQVITMSSGDRYSIRRREPRIEFSHDDWDRAVVVNSPVLAPAAYSFADPQIYNADAGLDFVPRALADRYGDIDVLHFQNLEGLTRSFFRELRRVFPRARILYSAHNYHPLCQRVTLWFQNRSVCGDYRNGVACTECRAPAFDPNYIRNRRRLAWAENAYPRLMSILSPGVALAKAVRRWSLPRRSTPVDGDPGDIPTAAGAAADYAAFREGNLALCRDVFDAVLAVSRQTAKVIVDRGGPAAKVAVSYIGTAHKDAFLRNPRIVETGGELHLGYIGYMGRDKGFYFLLDCLERMDAATAARTRVTVAAKNADPAGHARLLALKARFKQVRYFDGYTHADLDEVLCGVNLGLIPVLWEDNLPQTAIELVSRGIAILTSDRGGAQEIADNPLFIHRAGDRADFLDRVGRIAAGSLPLAAFWEGPLRIYSMDEHVENLMRYYRPPAT